MVRVLRHSPTASPPRSESEAYPPQHLLRRLGSYLIAIFAIFGFVAWAFADRYATHVEGCKGQEHAAQAPLVSVPAPTTADCITEGWFFSLQAISTIGFGSQHLACPAARSIANELMFVTLALWLVVFPMMFKWVIG